MNLLPADRPLPASHGNAAPEASDNVSPAELQAQVQRILSSNFFVKAKRSSALLRYLTGEAGSTSIRLLNEYAIGMEVFQRNAAAYSTGEDPIVRVEMGRLRNRLDAYYADSGRTDPIHISIPLRSYALKAERRTAAQRVALALVPLAHGQASHLSAFTDGLNDELRHRLYLQFGSGMLHVAQRGAWQSNVSPQFMLEGSVRTDGTIVRTHLRLLDVARATTAWSVQFDHGHDLSIARQEQLADLCCGAVRERLAWM